VVDILPNPPEDRFGQNPETEPHILSNQESTDYVLDWWQPLLLLVGLAVLSLIVMIITRSNTSMRMSAFLTESFAFLVPALIVIFASRVRRSPQLRLGKLVTLTRLALLVIIGFSSTCAVAILTDVANDIYPIPKSLLEHMIELLWADSTAGLIGVVITVAVVPAIAEELVFRGILQPSMIRIAGVPGGIGLTALFFSMYHLNPWTFVPILIVGVLLGLLVHWSKSVWAGVLTHFGANLVATTFTNSHESMDYEILTQRESPVIFLLGLPVALAGTYIFYRLVRGEEHSVHTAEPGD